MGTPSPPSNQAGPSPPPSPLGYVPRPLQTDQGQAGLREIVLQPRIRGRRPPQHLEEDVETILGSSARLYEVRQLSWRPAQVDQHARASVYRRAPQENQGGPVQPRRVQGGPVRGMSLYKGSPCTFLPLSSNMQRRPRLLTHREEKLSVKSNPTRIRERTLLRRFAGHNSKKNTTF